MAVAHSSWTGGKFLSSNTQDFIEVDGTEPYAVGTPIPEL